MLLIFLTQAGFGQRVGNLEQKRVLYKWTLKLMSEIAECIAQRP